MIDIDAQLLDRIAQERRYEARTIEIARRLFVHRETPKRLSLEYGIHVQRVYTLRREILEAARALALPPGWEEVTISGPKELIEQIVRQVIEAQGKVHGVGLEDGGVA